MKPHGLLRALSIAMQVWREILMDFITRLPKRQGKDTIMAVIDRLSKLIHFVAPRAYSQLGCKNRLILFGIGRFK